MTYQIKKCPQCGNVYESKTYSFHPSKANRTVYGSLLVSCRHCHNLFIDTDRREIAVEGVRPIDESMISPQSLFVGIVLIIAGCIVMAETIFGGLALFLLGLIPAVLELTSFKDRQASLEKERKLSEERLKNPLYAQLLIARGYNVPEKYHPSKKDDNNLKEGGKFND